MTEKMNQITKEAIKSARACLEQGLLAVAFSHLRTKRVSSGVGSRNFHPCKLIRNDFPDILVEFEHFVFPVSGSRDIGIDSREVRFGELIHDLLVR